jgi:hypothetical protein
MTFPEAEGAVLEIAESEIRQEGPTTLAGSTWSGLSLNMSKNDDALTLSAEGLELGRTDFGPFMEYGMAANEAQKARRDCMNAAEGYEQYRACQDQDDTAQAELRRQFPLEALTGFGGMTLTRMSLKYMEDDEGMTLAVGRLALENRAPDAEKTLHFGLALSGFDLSFAGLDASDARSFSRETGLPESYMLKPIRISGDLDMLWDGEKQVFRFENRDIILADGFKSSSYVEFGQIPWLGDLLSAKGETDAQMQFMGAQLNSAALDFENHGYFEAMLDTAAKDEGTTRAELISQAKDGLEQAAPMMKGHAGGEQLLAAVRSFLDDPGAIHIKAAPPRPLMLMQLGMMAGMGADSPGAIIDMMGITASAEGKSEIDAE